MYVILRLLGKKYITINNITYYDYYIRKEIEGIPYFYEVKNDSDDINIYKYNYGIGTQLLGPTVEFIDKASEYVYKEIMRGSGSSFHIDKIEKILDKLYLPKFKAGSSEKFDIEVYVKDYDNHYKQTGFSVKSFLGRAPCLLSATGNTSATYNIDNITDDIMLMVNGLFENNNKNIPVGKRVENLLISSAKFYPTYFNCATFEASLNSITPDLSYILQYFLFLYYRGVCNNFADMINYISVKNPLKYKNLSLYQKKVKKFLIECIYTIQPKKPWEESILSNNGIITVNRDGHLDIFIPFSKNDFSKLGNFLIFNAHMDRGSANRYNYGYVFKEESKYKMDLNMQLRFNSSVKSF